VIGLANDGPDSETPFIDLVFNSDAFADSAFGVVLGGGPQYFDGESSSRSYGLNLSTSDDSTFIN
jgi:hypothetical protein